MQNPLDNFWIKVLQELIDEERLKKKVNILIEKIDEKLAEESEMEADVNARVLKEEGISVLYLMRKYKITLEKAHSVIAEALRKRES